MRCEQCPEGSFISHAMLQCAACPVGSKPNEDQTGCTPCEDDTNEICRGSENTAITEKAEGKDLVQDDRT